jgi:hypothetical protein
MNVDEILQTLNEGQVDYLLIGGMNFLIRHLPELTFDVDIWVRDDTENLGRLNQRRVGTDGKRMASCAQRLALAGESRRFLPHDQARSLGHLSRRARIGREVSRV